ncbi:MAG: hypothetical protein U0350_41415 [Caldilineaceae bacterium]
MIVINELPIIAKHYALLLFASSERKFREFLAQVVMARNRTYIRYAYEVRPQVTREVLTMAGISATLSRKDLQFMAEDIGPELVPFLKPEDILKGMDPGKQRKLVSFLKPEDLLQGMDVEKQRELIALLSSNEAFADLSAEDQLRLARLSLEKLRKGMGLERLLSEMSADSRKQLLESLLKMQASSLDE